MSDNINEAKSIKRDDNGLVVGLEYKYTEEGLIDWRALIPTKFLYLKNDLKSRPRLEKKYGKNYNEIDIIKDNVADNDLIINLAGLKFIGRIRGISEVKEIVNVADESYASVTSTITYYPNIESEMKPISFSTSACATLANTIDFYQRYLVEAASNRAFARNIKSLLNINILSREELGQENEDTKDEPSNHSLSPTQSFKNLLKTKGYTFEQIRKKMIMDGDKDAASYEKPEDVPPSKIRKIIEKLKELKIS